MIFLGLDLGQTSDRSAICGLDQSVRPRAGTAERESFYTLEYLYRWPIGTSYADVVRHVKDFVVTPPMHEPTLAIDRTGVGRAVYDLFLSLGVSANMIPVVITAGHKISEDPDDYSLHVPKAELVTTLEALHQDGRLIFADWVEDKDQLVREMRSFKRRLTASANQKFEANEGEKDDCVLALALALFAGERSNPTWDGGMGMAAKSASKWGDNPWDAPSFGKERSDPKEDYYR